MSHALQYCECNRDVVAQFGKMDADKSLILKCVCV